MRPRVKKREADRNPWLAKMGLYVCYNFGELKQFYQATIYNINNCIIIYCIAYTDMSVSFLYLHSEIDSEWQLRTKLYDKIYCLNFPIICCELSIYM